jgi:hypothetical protein
MVFSFPAVHNDRLAMPSSVLDMIKAVILANVWGDLIKVIMADPNRKD